MRLESLFKLTALSGSVTMARDILNDFTPEGVYRLLEDEKNRINREEFLRAQLAPYYTEAEVQKAVDVSPQAAGIEADVIDKLADICIKSETKKVTMVSAAAGVPGGFASVFATVYDARQFNRHVVMVMQELLYLYGWPSLEKGGRELDDDTRAKVKLFYRLMAGDKLAGQAITYYSKKYAEKIGDEVVKHTVKNGAKVVLKKGAEAAGVKMTEKAVSNFISKSIPFVGGAVSGSLTYLTFYPMARRLQRFLKSHPLTYENEEKEIDAKGEARQKLLGK